MTIEELVSVCDESLSLSNDMAEQFYAFGYAQYQSGNWEKASSVFSLLCARRPLEAKFWFGLGASLQESKNYEPAMRAWAMTALLDPENPHPHFHAAECAISMKKTQDAKFALLEAEKRADSYSELKGRITLLKGAL